MEKNRLKLNSQSEWSEHIDLDFLSMDQIAENPLIHCGLCGSNLKFSHAIDYAVLSIEEKAHCPSCGMTQKQTLHGIH
ncbi:MAG: hypothetical protein COT74_03065 [Bdellovibrionales bacterium CG10_big_fil_rev_8_21_14_0_10_45_34]|nr:MAG: hypothetical protein COT74_03065 [Bdellovibrionales bacterium CG10_big_fil_rev_8_21_14_0_10_45_34]